MNDQRNRDAGLLIGGRGPFNPGMRMLRPGVSDDREEEGSNACDVLTRLAAPWTEPSPDNR
jgi:hypothetical protein